MSLHGKAISYTKEGMSAIRLVYTCPVGFSRHSWWAFTVKF